MRDDVSALYVDKLGCYPKLVTDWWDEKRDARLYDGPRPVVAHPPCDAYCAVRHLGSGAGADCAAFAITTVRRWGGVLEQPKGSLMFGMYGLPRPGELPDAWGGVTVEVSQCNWGHPARKMTWLYLVGVSGLPPIPPSREPTHWCSGRRGMARASANVPPGIKVCSAQQRRRTPVAFAEWLLDVAASARRAEAA